MEEPEKINYPEVPDIFFNHIASYKNLIYKTITSENFYFKTCKWSPDNLCLLVSDSNCQASVYNLPPLCYGISDQTWSSALSICEGELIYGADWYPLMDSSRPETCFFVTSSKDHPVHMWDAYTGTLKASFCCLSSAMEPVSPVGIAFKPDGSHLVCGLKNTIEIFDVNRPQDGPIKSINSKKIKSFHNGIFSCFAFTNTDVYESLMAVGSYSKSVGFYDLRECDFVSSINLAEYLNKYNLNIGGVTDVQFHGKDLYIGFRHCDVIARFDIRSLQTEFQLYVRRVNNQQSIQFSINESTGLMFSGDTDGCLNIYDTKNPSTDKPILPFKRFQMAKNSLPGCDFNEAYNLLSMASGSRSFKVHELSSERPIDENEISSLDAYQLSFMPHT